MNLMYAKPMFRQQKTAEKYQRNIETHSLIINRQIQSEKEEKPKQTNRQTIVKKNNTQYRKLKTEQDEHQQKTGGALERYVDPVVHIVHVVLIVVVRPK